MSDSRKTILINSYVLSPYKGSEAAVAWNHIRNMSQDYNLIVLYGASAEYMGDDRDIKKWLENNELPNVRFEFVRPSFISRILTWINRHGFVYAHFPAFRLWQKRVLKHARRIISSEHVDIVHHLGPIGYREPGYLWKLDKPYVWGPVGGYNLAPKVLLPLLPFMGRCKQAFRNVTNRYQMRHSRRVLKAMAKADIVVGATTECVGMIKELYGRDALYLAENCIDQNIHLNVDKFKESVKHIIFVGSVDSRKCVSLQLKALVKLKDRKDWTFDIVGEGPLRPVLEKFCQENGLSDKVKFHGKVSRNEAISLFNDASLHLITSVSEGNPTTVWEAMSHGVPTLTLDHCGMHDTINERNGIKIPITDPDTIVSDIASQIEYLLDNPEVLEKLGESTVDEAYKYTLDKRRAIFSELYEQAVLNYNANRRNLAKA